MALTKLIAGLSFAGAVYSSAFAATLVVPGTSDIYGAGHSSFAVLDGGEGGGGGGGYGILPPSFTLNGSISVVTFSNITGNISLEGGEFNNAKGDGSPFATTSIDSASGVSGITAPQAGFLVGVFTSDEEPEDPAPATLDFTTGNGTNFTTLSPALNQTFFIGNGLTSNGTQQHFNVPAGATHLYLGIADGDSASGPPGFYSDNGGYFTVSANIPYPVAGVSVNPSGNLCDNNSFESTISGNGKVVAFTSIANDLVPAFDPTGLTQVFVWNSSNNTVSAVSTDGDGNPGNGASYHPRLSNNGMFLVYSSYASNIVSNDYNGVGDIFYVNLCTGETQLVSESQQWYMSANGDSGDAPAISGDGNYVAFSSTATDLFSGCDTVSYKSPSGTTAGNTTGPQLYRWNANNQELELLSFAFDSDEDVPVSYPSDIPQVQRICNQPAADGDGGSIAFVSNAANFEDGNIDGPAQVYLYVGGGCDTVTLLSVDNDDNPANAICNNPSISDDGNTISFETAASNLIKGAPANVTEIYITDSTGEDGVTLGSSAADGTPANANCVNSHLSANGHLLIFTSNATNLIPGVGGNTSAIFIKNLLTGSIISGHGSDGANSASFSGDTRYVAYTQLISGFTGQTIGGGQPLWQVLRADLGQSAPVFKTQPDDDEVNEGDSASFTVCATGIPNPTYQWYFNSEPIDGATNATYKICNAALDQQGEYYCVATNAIDSVQSDSAYLTVDAPPGPQAPYFTSITGSTYVVSGTQVTFDAEASGDEPITFQWYVYNGTSGNFDAIPGATDNTLVFNCVHDSDAGFYEVVASNDAGNTTSDEIGLQVLDPTDPPGIINEPEDLEVTQDDDASFSVSAFGEGPITYQWYTTDGTNITLIPDATDSTYDIPSAQLSDATGYFVSVINDNGVTNSTVADLTVDPGQAPTIDYGPFNATLNAGQYADFYVGAEGTGDLSYQWYFNDTLVPDQTNSDYFLGPITLADAGNYSVNISNAFGNITSDEATLTVLPALAAPEITLQPIGGNIATGRTATLAVSATGNPAPQFQWLLNGNPLSDGANITGSTTDSLQISHITPASTGSYSVIVYNGIGVPVESNIVPVSVLFKPQIIQQPRALLARVGYQAVFSVVATGYPTTFTYQWIKNGKPLVPSRVKRFPRDSGLNSNRFVITSVQSTDAGTYQVRVTNSQGSVLSSIVGLQLRTIKAPSK
jgi:hypothetical protein